MKYIFISPVPSLLVMVAVIIMMWAMLVFGPDAPGLW